MFLFVKNDQGKLKRLEYGQEMELSEPPVWIDLFMMKPQEENFLEKLIGIDIPSQEEMHEIELSNRLYSDNNHFVMTVSLLIKSQSNDPDIHAVTFILSKNTLVTIRYCEPPSFLKILNELESFPDSWHQPFFIFAGLIEGIINLSADYLEKAGQSVDEMNRQIFLNNRSPSAKIDFKELLAHIGHEADVTSKTRESLVTLNRMISYVLQTQLLKSNEEVYDRLTVVAKDIVALSDHASFISNKVNFLLDATLGMLNIEQNNIIKIFSVAAVIFLPPTLIASIYGMNFNMMPELSWQYGYIYALLLMLLSAWLPYKYFKKKKWF